MKETIDLARFLAGVNYQDLTDEVIEKAKSLLIDQFGCELAFATMPWSRAVYEYVKSREGGRKESTVNYYGLKTIDEDAAFANAIFGHGFEMDDTEMHTITHPGSVVIPSALAVGETAGISGKDFLTAVVTGYEAMLRVGMAARAMIDRSFHGTGVAGTFGAAAAACKVLKFDAALMTHALAIAGSQSGGISEYTISGGSVKRLHAGFAAQSGIRAARLARLGLTGPATVLEGKKGFCQAFADEYYPEEITAGFSKPFRIMWTGNKPYCCCAAQHTTIDATAGIMKEHPFKPDNIAAITIAQAARDVKNVGNIIKPEDILSAQFSGRFGVALRLIKGSNGFNDYTPNNLKDPAILGLAKKVSYIIDKKFDAAPPGMAPAAVTIRLNDGTVYQKQVDYARGTVQKPMTGRELEDKFRGLASMALPEKQVENIIKTVSELENIKNIRQLSSLLVAEK
jgi:2-methylcitrate dehydratase PrpD